VRTYVALLRGVNVGGKNRVAMPKLRSSLAELGLEDVVTYVQSGNVVFRSPSRKGVETRIGKLIADEFGLEIAVLVRTPAELAKIAKANPFRKHEQDPLKLHVVFLSGKPAVKAVAGLDPDRSPGDEFNVEGSEIYLHLPNGSGRSKLTIDYFERRLGVKATARNWKTVEKLLELAKA
jgi:uncharacterized protein (DUF1697 family)